MDCLEGLKLIPYNRVDLVVTDAPYGINYFSGYYKDKNPHKKIVNDDVLFLPLDELWRVLKPTGAIFAFFSHKKPLIDERIRNTIIWVKNNWTAGDLYADFGNQYESIAFLPKKDFKLRSKRFSNVWAFDRVPAHKLRHPTEKPLKLIMRLIEAGSNEGGVVLDIFMGSGTTAKACKCLKRDFIGFEIDKSYCEVAEKRLKQETLIGLQ